jgi:lipid-A-disaccharide synthase
MAAAGQTRVIRAEDVAHMGITEVLRHMPRVFRAYRALVADLRRNRPALAILIDFPDVNFRLAKHCKRLGIPVLWFVSPQLWAWKRRRLRWVQQRVTKMLVIFPFETPFYCARGVDAEFVGHPLATLPLPAISREAYASENNLDPASEWIALLPGSRQKEVEANLPGLLEAVGNLDIRQHHEYLLPVASTLSQPWMVEYIARWVRSNERNLRRIPVIRLVLEARPSLHYARASIVASGTATVQALTIGNPFIVVYRVSPLTYALAKRLILYPAEIGDPNELKDADGNLPIAMVNLIAGRRIVPELLNDRFTSANVAAALRPLLDDTPARSQMIADLAAARTRLLPTPNANPIQRVCDIALELLAPTPAPTAETPTGSV